MRFWKIITLAMIVFLSGCGVKGELTQKEKEYINTHIVVWAAEDNYYPFVYIDRFGEPHGLSVDYMKLVSEKTGLKFRLAKHGQLTDILDHLHQGHVDLVTSVRTTPDRSTYASFSRPYILIDLVLVKRTNVPKTVGVGKGYAIEGYLRAARKDLQVVEFLDDEESYKALIAGTVDSVAMDVPSLTALVEKYKAEFDKSSIPFEYPLSFAVAKDNAVLRSILDKAITGITDEETEVIKIKWM